MGGKLYIRKSTGKHVTLIRIILLPNIPAKRDGEESSIHKFKMLYAKSFEICCIDANHFFLVINKLFKFSWNSSFRIWLDVIVI